MNRLFFIESFLVGLSVCLTIGPVFVLMFNRSALCGFLAGIATVIGASIADGILFSLGLLGILSVVASLAPLVFVFNVLAGAALLIFGLYVLFAAQSPVSTTAECNVSFVSASVRAFFMTIANPLTLFYFMVLSSQLVPPDASLRLGDIVKSGLIVCLGSCTSLSLVSLIAARFGASLSPQVLHRVTRATALVFVVLGVYLLSMALRGLFA